MKVIVATHKKTTFTREQGYYPLQLGRTINPNIDGIPGDDTGDNISDKNKEYCELTGLYWLWKSADENILGLVHYRRYFQSEKRLYNYNFKSILTEREVESYLLNFDILLPTKRVLDMSVKADYCKHHMESDWNILENIIKDYYPNYLESFNYVSGHNHCYLLNMLITRKDILNEYSDWLFGVLFKLELHLDTTNYDAYQSRVLGFISERLLNVWVHEKKLRIREIKVVSTELTMIEQVRGLIKDEVKRIVRLY